MLELFVIINYQLSKMIEHLDCGINRSSFRKSCDALPKETKLIGYLNENEWRVKFTTVNVIVKSKPERHKNKKVDVPALRFTFATAYHLSGLNQGLTFKCKNFSFRYILHDNQICYYVKHQLNDIFNSREFDQFTDKMEADRAYFQVAKRTYPAESNMSFYEAGEKILLNEECQLNNIGIQSNVSGKKYIDTEHGQKITKRDKEGTWSAIDWHFRNEDDLLTYLLPYYELTDSESTAN